MYIIVRLFLVLCIFCLIALVLPPALRAQVKLAQSQATPARTALPLPAANSTVFLGDSITTFGNALETGPSDTFGWGWTAQATFLSKGRIRQVNNAGVPSDTLARMLSRFPTDVESYSPVKVVIAGGTNDIPSTAITTSQLNAITSTLASIIDTAEATGIQPIVCNVPPREDAPVAIHEANAKAVAAAIQSLAAAKQTQYGNVVFFNLYAVVVNTSTGGYLAGYDLGDGIHPSVKAATAIANAFVSATSMVYGSSVYLPWSNTSSTNLAPNPLFINPIGYSWSAGYGTSPVPSVSVVAGGASIVGNWMQVTFPPATAAGQYYSYNLDNIAVTAGGNYALSFRFKISGLEANGGMVVITYGYNGPNASYTMLQDVTDGTFYLEAQAVGTQMNPGIIICPGLRGSITVNLAQVGLAAH
jgi:lysophospholipase L1-like esterase